MISVLPKHAPFCCVSQEGSATGTDEYEYVSTTWGNPVGGQNRLLARGAAPDDRLCVFDQAKSQFGCEVLSLGD